MGLKDIGLNITEQEYRDLEAISYSYLSAISRLNPKNVNNKVDPTEPMIFGTMVDSMMDNTFVRSDYYIAESIDIGEKIKPAIDLLLKFIDYQKVSSDLKNWDTQLLNILENNDIDYYKKRTGLSRMSSMLKDKGANAYFKSMIESKGKVIITQAMYDDAMICRSILKSHEFTKHIFGKRKQEEAVYQFKYKWDELGLSFKGMLDRLIVNHESKTIKPYDLKTGGKSALDFQKSFYQYRYDIQGVLYYIICRRIKNLYYPDYTIENFRFVYIGRFEKLPLIWEMPMAHFKMTIKGYVRNGITYKGINQLLKDLEFYKGKDFKVDYPEKIYVDKGVINIPMNGINELKE